MNIHKIISLKTYSTLALFFDLAYLNCKMLLILVFASVFQIILQTKLFKNYRFHKTESTSTAGKVTLTAINVAFPCGIVMLTTINVAFPRGIVMLTAINVAFPCGIVMLTAINVAFPLTTEAIGGG